MKSTNSDYGFLVESEMEMLGFAVDFGNGFAETMEEKLKLGFSVVKELNQE